MAYLMLKEKPELGELYFKSWNKAVPVNFSLFIFEKPAYTLLRHSKFLFKR